MAFSRTTDYVHVQPIRPITVSTIENHDALSPDKVAWRRLRTLLIAGREKYAYVSGANNRFTVHETEPIEQCLALDPIRTIEEIVRVSVEGKAATNDAAIFALAVAAFKDKNTETRKMAWAAFAAVVRTGAHLFEFVHYNQLLNGGKWYISRAGRLAVSSWYAALRGNDPERPWLPLIHEIMAHRSRSDGGHASVIRLYSPNPVDDEQDVCFGFASNGGIVRWSNRSYVNRSDFPLVSEASRATSCIYSLGSSGNDPESLAELSRVVDRLHLGTHAVQQRSLSNQDILMAMAKNMTVHDLLHLLPNFSSARIFDDPAWLRMACDRLDDTDLLHANGVTAMDLFWSNSRYQIGASGSLFWTIYDDIVSALSRGFAALARRGQPSTKRVLIGIDVSSASSVYTVGLVTQSLMASTCLATARYAANPETTNVVLAHNSVHPCPPLVPEDPMGAIGEASYDFRVAEMHNVISYAAKNNLSVDTILLLTNGRSTPYPSSHPIAREIRHYRETINRTTQLIVARFDGGPRTMEDVDDPFTFEVSGFNNRTSHVISSLIES